jgi:hypothetical protein
LADWKASTLQDASSVSAPVNFVSHSDLHLSAGSIGNTILAGTPLAHVNTDYDNATRSNTYPYMGADENSAPVPVRLLSFNARGMNGDVHADWVTASEKNVSHFVVQASADGRTFRPVGRVEAKGNSSAALRYSFIHPNAQREFNNAGVLYYRLVSVDVDAATSLSGIARVDFSNSRLMAQTMVYPNPFVSGLKINVPASEGGLLTVSILDLQGKVVGEFTRTLKQGINELSLDEADRLDKGMYIMQLSANGESQTFKLIRK